MPILEDCCCAYPLKKGTIVVGVVYLLIDLLEIGLSAYYIHASPEEIATKNAPFLYGTICVFLIDVILSTFLIVVTIKENAVLVLSWIFVKIPLSIIQIVLECMSLANSGSFEETLHLAFVLTLTVIIAVSLTVYAMLVVYSYYQTLRDN